MSTVQHSWNARSCLHQKGSAWSRRRNRLQADALTTSQKLDQGSRLNEHSSQGYGNATLHICLQERALQVSETLKATMLCTLGQHTKHDLLQPQGPYFISVVPSGSSQQESLRLKVTAGTADHSCLGPPQVTAVMAPGLCGIPWSERIRQALQAPRFTLCCAETDASARAWAVPADARTA